MKPTIGIGFLSIQAATLYNFVASMSPHPEGPSKERACSLSCINPALLVRSVRILCVDISLSIYIYIYKHTCVCVCECARVYLHVSAHMHRHTMLQCKS